MRTKRPKVKTLIGSVRISKIGFIVALIMPSKRATKNAERKLVTTTPGRISEVINTERL